MASISTGLLCRAIWRAAFTALYTTRRSLPSALNASHRRTTRMPNCVQPIACTTTGNGISAILLTCRCRDGVSVVATREYNWATLKTSQQKEETDESGGEVEGGMCIALTSGTLVEVDANNASIVWLSFQSVDGANSLRDLSCERRTDCHVVELRRAVVHGHCFPTP